MDTVVGMGWGWVCLEMPGELVGSAHLQSPYLRDQGAAILGKNSSQERRHWRRKWQPTPVLLPGKFHGQRSLAGCSPWGCKESNTTERLTHCYTTVFIMLHMDKDKSQTYTILKYQESAEVPVTRKFLFNLQASGYSHTKNISSSLKYL